MTGEPIMLKILDVEPPEPTEGDDWIAGITERGFALTGFHDQYGNKCSIQKSSSAMQDCIWLGIDQVEPIREGEEVYYFGRMHLNQEQVSKLLPLLQHFVEHGELPEQD